MAAASWALIQTEPSLIGLLRFDSSARHRDLAP